MVFLRRLRKFIHSAFTPRYLLFTNMTISATLSGSGDLLEQHYEMHTDEQENWDPHRTRIMTTSGVFIGFICHHWYKWIDYVLPGRALSTVLKKMLLDQLICSPVTISTFLLGTCLMEGRSQQDCLNELKHKGLQLYRAEWVVWPPAQFINFYILPHRFRVLYDNTISLGYDVYTSKIKYRKDGDS